MTCKDCVHYEFCSDQYGNTDYFDDEVIDSLVEELCSSFKDGTNFVNVVRCKDCRRCYKRITKRNKQTMYFCMRMDGNEFKVNANDYCSYGKKVTKNE